PQARALRHLFFAERRAAKSVGLREKRPLASVAVLGGGWIGAGLAAELLRHGLCVTLVEVARDPLAAALSRVARMQEADLARGRLSLEKQQADWDRLQPATALAACATADLVIEAIDEDLGHKTALLRALSGVRAGQGPVLSVTCGLDTGALATAYGRAGAHGSLFVADPVRRTDLAELAATGQPGDLATDAAQTLARLLGWRLIRQQPGRAFLAPRLLTALFDAADRFLAAGCDPAEVDRALRGYGYATGAFALRDVYGPDHALLRHALRRKGVLPAPLSAAVAGFMHKEGRRGRRSKAGYYLYPDAGGPGRADPHLLAFLDGLRGRAAVAAAKLHLDLTAALANEGAWALSQDQARCPSDIDLIAVAQGFPRWRGGPMQAADEAGLLTLRSLLRDWANGGDPFWEPAPLWDDLIRNGRKFADLNPQ
ncbi:MAG: 3-hydroxyacyl-CoA dehydrogenase NAD-binding domain-containing protein, partial [Rhodobacteraceae bacterium]|nr:3-hydroxyacyl-CoA dehydrogenase NAD-binding domain-containing protein [Paracoccaceae bacterium]